MLHRLVVAIGAGCAAALLFVVSAQSSLLAMALAYLAPLPIMIATLGWGLDGGAIAAAISIAVLAVIAEPLSAAGLRRLGRCSRLGPGRFLGHAARALSQAAEAERAGPRAGRRHRLARGAPGNARRRRGADDGHRGLRRLWPSRAPRRGGDHHPCRRRLRERAGQRDGARVRRRARAIRPDGDRRLDADDAVRQPLWRGAFHPIVAQSPEAMARRAEFAGASLAGRGRIPRLSRAAPTPCPPRPRNISPSASEGSAPRWRCRASRSRTRCRAASRCARSCWSRSTPAACCGPNTPFRFLPASGIIDGFLKLRSRAALIASPSPTGQTRR